jgi:hypothetical protein
MSSRRAIIPHPENRRSAPLEPRAIDNKVRCRAPPSDCCCPSAASPRTSSHRVMLHAGRAIAPGSLLGPTRLVDRPLAGNVRAPAAPTPCRGSAIALPQPAPYGLGLLFQLSVVAAGVARIVRRPSGADHARGQVVLVLVPPAFGHEARARQTLLDFLHAACHRRSAQAVRERGMGASSGPQSPAVGDASCAPFRCVDSPNAYALMADTERMPVYHRRGMAGDQVAYRARLLSLCAGTENQRASADQNAHVFPRCGAWVILSHGSAAYRRRRPSSFAGQLAALSNHRGDKPCKTSSAPKRRQRPDREPTRRVGRLPCRVRDHPSQALPDQNVGRPARSEPRGAPLSCDP